VNKDFVNSAHFSDAKQDLFVRALNKGKKGTYVDIGSHSAIASNNSYLHEINGWDGICIEKESVHNSEYNVRKCLYLNRDALTIDYSDLFTYFGEINTIDYLSIDIDTLSYEVLTKMPFEEYKFGIITIEHDFYLYGGKYKEKQKTLLLEQGYQLACENVLVEQVGYEGKRCEFEDWWVHPSMHKLDKGYIGKYPSEIIKEIK